MTTIGLLMCSNTPGDNYCSVNILYNFLETNGSVSEKYRIRFAVIECQSRFSGVGRVICGVQLLLQKKPIYRDVALIMAHVREHKGGFCVSSTSNLLFYFLILHK